MKAVQIGILAALVVCAGLLFMVYRGQQAAPVATPATTQAAPAPADATSAASQPAATPADQAAPAPAAAQSEPVRHKPSPSRSSSKKGGAEMAQNRPPELLSPASAASPAASQQPAPVETPAPQPAVAAPVAPAAPPAPREPNRVTLPAGTTVTVRLGETLSSEKNQPGDTFSGTLDQPIIVDGFAIAERGSRIQGKLTEVERAGRVKGVAHLALQLTKIHTADGQDVAVSTERFAKEGPTSKGEDAKKVGIGTAIGAAIGAIAGGGKGAAIGAGVGAGAGAGTVAATRGKAAELPVETRLTFRLQEPVTITEKIR